MQPALIKANSPASSFNIQQRRYLGNKYKVLDLIDKVITENIGEYNSFCDIFAGTGIVGSYYNAKDVKIISNDILSSNYTSLYAWLSDESYSIDNIAKYIHYFNSIEVHNNYVSENFGGKYFSKDNALKIGTIREEIETLKISFKEKSILLTSLLYAMDKIANTVGHYDAYFLSAMVDKPIFLELPHIKQENNANNQIFNLDANDLIKEVEADILYLDPPYNSRQYCDAYHILENIILWKKPELNGKALKFDRSELKSKYNLTSATDALEDLIKNAKAKYILFSYNNMANKGNSRSNARITDIDILRILKSKGSVEIYEKDYKGFQTGKSNVENNKERVFFCEVKYA